jgi:hypothetical protein
LRLHPQGSSESVQLLQDTVDLQSSSPRRRQIDLQPFAYRRVKLCVETQEVGAAADKPTEEVAYWVNPAISSRRDARQTDEEAANLFADLTEEEIEVRKRHLKALGYVD